MQTRTVEPTSPCFIAVWPVLTPICAFPFCSFGGLVSAAFAFWASGQPHTSPTTHIHTHTHTSTHTSYFLTLPGVRAPGGSRRRRAWSRGGSWPWRWSASGGGAPVGGWLWLVVVVVVGCWFNTMVKLGREGRSAGHRLVSYQLLHQQCLYVCNVRTMAAPTPQPTTGSLAAQSSDACMQMRTWARSPWKVMRQILSRDL